MERCWLTPGSYDAPLRNVFVGQNLLRCQNTGISYISNNSQHRGAINASRGVELMARKLKRQDTIFMLSFEESLLAFLNKVGI